jgi:RNA polymerase-binding transcription factor DksA
MPGDRSSGRVPPAVQAELSRALEHERARVRTAMDALAVAGEQLGAGQGDEGGAGSADADVASDLAEAELDLGLERTEMVRLAEVEDALDRVRTGSYGLCVQCDRTIQLERLRRLPWTRVCRACADTPLRSA